MKVPQILLVGAGRFGRIHLRVLKEFAAAGKIELAGAVIRNAKNRAAVEAEFGIKAFAAITPALLKSVDAVDIVTPPETHFALVKQCLPHTNVFVEKPLAMNGRDSLALEALARKHKRTLFVGHVFRYHPVAAKLKSLLQKRGLPRAIAGSFVNPLLTDQGRDPSLELLHLFDIVDFLWEKEPRVVNARGKKRISVAHIRYGRMCDGRFELGWRGEEKSRLLSFSYPDMKVEADFIACIVKVGKKVYECPIKVEPLKAELLDFAAVLKGKKNPLHGKVGARLVSIAERAIPAGVSKPRIAVIGGGIFGTSAAAELGKFASVTVFERNDDLMKEGSFINQFRHHHGYHYPRSDDTVLDIQRSRGDFEAVFRDGIADQYPTYYGVAKKGSLVSAKEFLAFCAKHNLPFKESFPPHDLLSKDLMELCVEVPETNYHFDKLKAMAKMRLASNKDISVLYDTEVVGSTLNDDGTKTIAYKKKIGKKSGPRLEQRFDFIVNATYANMNKLAKWIDFESHPMRIDLAEALIVKLPIPPMSITVIDGPFATLMPTGRPNEFTLYHVKESIIDRYVPKDGLVKKHKKGVTRREAIYRESLKLFPILKQATIVESRIVHRGVRAHQEHTDSRVADVIEHGFGCWSILSGKILSSVSIAKRVSALIKESAKEEILP